MEQKNNEQKTAQILYITIIMVLLIMALTVGLVTASKRQSTPEITDVISSYQSTTAFSTTAKPPEKTAAIPKSTDAPVQTSVIPPAITSVPKPTVAEPIEPITPTFVAPVSGNVSQTFSIDTLVYSNTMEDYRTHNGIDIICGIGTGVAAAADGIITNVYEHPMMGYTVEISHEADFKTVYQNLAEDITVSVGDAVKSGDIIGAIGESAIIEIAEEPHLHFEMTVGNERVNPENYLSDAQMTVSYEE